MKNQTLYYKEPANPNVWEEALPLGNGSFGAMVYGGVDCEVIKLNQESVWFGKERMRVNPSSKESLNQVRDLLFNGQLSKAEELAYTNMFGTPTSQGHYEPLANLHIHFYKKIKHHSQWGQAHLKYRDYSRKLDLSQALYQCSYGEEDGQHLSREAFISYVDDVMAIMLEAEDLSFRLELERSDQFESVAAKDHRIVLKGSSGGGGSSFVAMAHVEIVGGSIEKAGAYLNVQDSKKAIIYVTGRTDFYGQDPLGWCHHTLDLALEKGYDHIKQEHVEDYQKLYLRNQLDIGEEPSELDTKERLQAFKLGSQDKGLLELYYNYGRYLLISSSRQGNLPGNLQGIWNQEMTPPWGCKYTININTQMNYWPAETTNLSECHEALFDHILRMLPRARQVAKDMYGLRGAVAHHNTDIFGDCAPQDQWMPATIWPMGLAWLSLHIIEGFRFNLNPDFIKKYAHVLVEVSEFYFDFLVADENGHLVTCPSTSPENTYILPNGEKSALCYGPTMDSQIIRELWQGILYITKKVEGIFDLDFARKVEDFLGKLPETRLGSRGQIMEWTREYEEWEPGHRHISHLFGLIPGSTITQSGQPDLFEGAKVSIRERMASGGGHTGWSRAWIINMWARLHDGDEANDNLSLLMKHSTADNLFDMHPPFQIDGNFGGVAGIAEMLLQSHESFIRILPALPKSWGRGKVEGLKARGHITINIYWINNKCSRLDLLSPTSKEVRVLVNDRMETYQVKAGEWLSIHMID